MENILLTDEETKMVDEIKKIMSNTGFRKPLDSGKYPDKVWAHLTLFPIAFVTPNIKDKELEKSKLDKLKNIVNLPESKERDILTFFKDKSNLRMLNVIFNKFNTGNHEQYIFREFPLPNRKEVADFLLIGKSSDGYHEIFVEFEAVNGNSNNKVFTNKREEGIILRRGRQQVEQWEKSITELHQAHAENLKNYLNKDYSLPNELQINSPNRRHYVVVAGRRDDYKENYNQRLNLEKKNHIKILHYDNILEDIERNILFWGDKIEN